MTKPYIARTGLVLLLLLTTSVGVGALPLQDSKKKRGRKAEPSPALPAYSDEEKALLKSRISSGTLRKAFDLFVDRIESHCGETFGLSDELQTWLKEHPDIRRRFWLALDPERDKIAKAIEIFGGLLSRHPEQVLNFPDLAIATAVVWDDPQVVDRCRRSCIWGFEKEQFGEILSFEEAFLYYTDPSRKRIFLHDLTGLPWLFLVHLVNLDVSAEEAEWARKKYAAKKVNIGTVYSEVRYDHQKLKTKKPAIGKRPYTLMNILEHNGICGDQAHFATRSAKAVGIPAMKVSGHGRYGGSHAWGGYLVGRQGKPALVFTGRYRGDRYYTGDVIDPQTGRRSLERHVAMMYEGIAKDYQGYLEARTAARWAEDCRESDPEHSLALAEHAIEENELCLDGWISVCRHLESGNVDKSGAKRLFTTMVKACRNHPDVTLNGLDAFLKTLPEDDFKSRLKYSEMVFPLFAERPDLQITIRTWQCKQLVGSGNPLQTLSLALQTCIDNAEESKLILPLVRICVDIVIEKNLQAQTDRHFRQIDQAFPKMRGDEPSDAYAKFREMMEELN